MPVLLIDVCNNSEFSNIQKTVFWRNVLECFSRNPTAKPFDIAISCMRDVGDKYYSGGISAEPSLRSLILDQAMELLKHGYVLESEELVAVLVAMYHSPDYINSHGWFDYEVTIDRLPIGERVLVCAAFIALGGRYIPEIKDYTDEYILQQIEQSKEKMRAIRKAD